mmetsp:Transcript_26444/g.72716  ORF Transcript_26444/g.72716 Transcript_26444/m.72716 type:complete len:140 (-) Transcript_26444:369-788(-)
MMIIYEFFFRIICVLYNHVQRSDNRWDIEGSLAIVCGGQISQMNIDTSRWCCLPAGGLVSVSYIQFERRRFPSLSKHACTPQQEQHAHSICPSWQSDPNTVGPLAQMASGIDPINMLPSTRSVCIDDRFASDVGMDPVS